MNVSAASIVAMGIAMTLATGCNDATAPVAPPATTPTPSAPGGVFPALTHPGIYVEEGPIYQLYYQSQGSLISRYVLNDDNTFSLQFISATYGSFEYKGTYSISSNVVQFAFADRDSAGPWNATADLVSDELSVTYNDTMGMADFVNGKYRKSPTSP